MKTNKSEIEKEIDKIENTFKNYRINAKRISEEIKYKLNKKDWNNFQKYLKKELKYIKLKAKLKAFQSGILKAKDEIIKMIENIDTQIPDDDGIPADISATQFKAELLLKLKERK